MAFKAPKKLDLALKPTPIQPLDWWRKELGVSGLFVKRDDLTGIDLTGNKIRKLEYLLAEAKRKKASIVLTCGGIQSNHARATALAALQLGMKPLLFLRGKKFEISEGNLFLDKLIGASIRFITPEEYKNVNSLMEKEAGRLEKKGEKPYIIPEGGSNALGLLGYVDTVREIKAQEKQLRKKFDYVVTAVGSGGTLGGLLLGKKITRYSGDMIGFNVCDTADYFRKRIHGDIKAAARRFKVAGVKLAPEEIGVIDGYVGPGYALPAESTIQMIKKVARTEGLILDPVYTAKAFQGLVKEIEKEKLPKKANYLFIHTGGIFGLLAQRQHFDFL